MDDFIAPLGWGLSVGDIKFKMGKMFPTKNYFSAQQGWVDFGNAFLKNFEGDCGALYMQGANCVDDKDLECVTEFCSLSGFSKVFATVVQSGDTSTREELFKKHGWTLVHKGKSNRNPSKDDCVFVEGCPPLKFRNEHFFPFAKNKSRIGTEFLKCNQCSVELHIFQCCPTC